MTTHAPIRLQQPTRLRSVLGMTAVSVVLIGGAVLGLTRTQDDRTIPAPAASIPRVLPAAAPLTQLTTGPEHVAAGVTPRGGLAELWQELATGHGPTATMPDAAPSGIVCGTDARPTAC